MIEIGNHTHGHWIAKATNAAFSPGVEICISRSEQGKLLGGVIFGNYTGASACIDVAGFTPNWLSRNLLWLTFTYAFRQLGCRVLIGRLNSTNQKAIKFDTHIGFAEHSVIKDGVPNGDLILLTMRKEDCKWLNLKPTNLRVYDHLKKAA